MNPAPSLHYTISSLLPLQGCHRGPVPAGHGFCLRNAEEAESSGHGGARVPLSAAFPISARYRDAYAYPDHVCRVETSPISVSLRKLRGLRASFSPDAPSLDMPPPIARERVVEHTPKPLNVRRRIAPDPPTRLLSCGLVKTGLLSSISI